MYISDELEQAGRRAAELPIGAAPSLDYLQGEVARRRRNVQLASGVAVIALLFGGVGALAARTVDDNTTIVSASPADEEGAQASATVDADNSSLPSDPGDGSSQAAFASESADADSGSESVADSGSESGTESVTWWSGARYTDGDEAQVRADAAAAAADETRITRERTIWIDRFERADGKDAVTVSTMIEDRFLEVSGPAELEESLINAVLNADGVDGEKYWENEAKDWEDYAQEWKDYGEQWRIWAEEQWKDDSSPGWSNWAVWPDWPDSSTSSTQSDEAATTGPDSSSSTESSSTESSSTGSSSTGSSSTGSSGDSEVADSDNTGDDSSSTETDEPSSTPTDSDQDANEEPAETTWEDYAEEWQDWAEEWGEFPQEWEDWPKFFPSSSGD